MVKLDPAKVRWIIKQKKQDDLSTGLMASELKELETPAKAFYRKLAGEGDGLLSRWLLAEVIA